MKTPSKIENILGEVWDLPPDQRARYIDEVCGDDMALLREVESLIKADEDAGDFLVSTNPMNSANRAKGETEPQRPLPSGQPLILKSLLPHLGLRPSGFEPSRAEGWPLVEGERCGALAGRYRVSRLLGRGGMGEVYRADDLKLGEPVALKFLPEPMAWNRDLLSRFLREAKIARRITHPNVCRVYDIGEVGGHHFISMEYIEGENLASLLKRIGRPGRAEAMEILLQLCGGLAAVHEQGILHRDLKPSNLMVDNRGRLRITDFGVAKLGEGTAGENVRYGTPSHMAPEQHAGGQVSVRTDIYAFGLVMYELLTGRPPYKADSAIEYSRLHLETLPIPPSQVVGDLDEALEELILLCLAKDPANRPSSIAEVTAALRGTAREKGVIRSRTDLALHQLPPPPADFTGRQDELDELREAVEHRGAAVSALRGMGGIGKTVLALKLAEELTPLFPDAQLYLDLKGASAEPLTAFQVMTHVIQSYRPECPLPTTEEQITAHYRSVLHGQRALLLMDNAADREQVEPLLPPRSCVLLVTSRRTFSLPGMFAIGLEILPSEDAVRFLQTAVSRIGNKASEIAQLCGNLPIALRLAGNTLAERRDLAPSEYADRLAEGRGRLELIEASFALSYDLLTDEQKILWRALAVFPGTFDGRAVAAIWEMDSERADIHIGELVRNGLVEWSAGRFRLHDLSRIFADHHLGEGECFGYQQLLSEHYLGVLKQADALYTGGGKEGICGLHLLDTEWENIQTGQAWSEAHKERTLTIARLCNNYPGYNCLFRLPPKTWIRWREAALEAARRLNDLGAQSRHLAHLGFTCAGFGEPLRGVMLGEAAVTMASEVGDRDGECRSLGLLGGVCTYLGELRRSIELHNRAVTIARETGDQRREGIFLNNLAWAYSAIGEPQRSIGILEQALDIAGELGSQHLESAILLHLGWANVLLSRPEYAIGFYQKALIFPREIGYRSFEADVLGNLAWAYQDLGNPCCSVEFAEEALAIACDLDDRRRQGYSQLYLGRAYLLIGKQQSSVKLLEQATAIGRTVGDIRLKSYSSWILGQHYVEVGQPARAADLMQVRVNYEKSIGHSEAAAHAARVDEIRALSAGG